MDNFEENKFDFISHKAKAISDFRKIRALYETFCLTGKSILEKSLQSLNIEYHSIEARAKDLEKFGEKAAKPSNDDINQPKYEFPMNQITDLAGIRIITFYPKTIEELDTIINSEFDVIEKSNKNDLLEQDEKFGYSSVHYLIKLKHTRTSLSEYSSFKGLVAEVQVRTILQHAWAEIEHDIEYKSSITIPKQIKRRFMSLAGMLEIADREFQSIHNENEELKQIFRNSINSGKLHDIEITSDSIKTYLNKKFGSDARVTDVSYDILADHLVKIGFKNLKEIDTCVSQFDDTKISKLLWGTRQGQISRFEDVIIAAIGEDIINRHPWCLIEEGRYGADFWKKMFTQKLITLKDNGINVGIFKPTN